MKTVIKPWECFNFLYSSYRVARIFLLPHTATAARTVGDAQEAERDMARAGDLD